MSHKRCVFIAIYNMKGAPIGCSVGAANFSFVDGRCHLEQSLPFPTTVDTICNNIHCKKNVNGTESSCWHSGCV